MSVISAIDLKTKGVKAIEDALLAQLEAPVTVRGRVKYVEMQRAISAFTRVRARSCIGGI